MSSPAWKERRKKVKQDIFSRKMRREYLRADRERRAPRFRVRFGGRWHIFSITAWAELPEEPVDA